MRDHGFEAAVAYFERALKHPSIDPIAVPIELGEARQLAGGIDSARTMLLRAPREAEAEAAGRTAELTHAALALGGGPAGFEVPLADLARRTGTDERYLLEWLQGQAIAVFVSADGPDPATATYRLAEGTCDAFVAESSQTHLGGLADVVAAAAAVLPQLVHAFRSGEGVPYTACGLGRGRTGGAQPSGLRQPARRYVAARLPRRPDAA